MSNKYPYSYLLSLSYLGFRYHGWQKQPEVKTVQGMLERTLFYVFDHNNFKTLGAGRTDAMVSAKDFKCELFLSEPAPDDLQFLINQNLPQDIQLNSINLKEQSFNIIQDIKEKEYHYYFYTSEKDPFLSPLNIHRTEKFDHLKLQSACEAFIGKHNFYSFSESEEKLHCEREIKECFLTQIKPFHFQITFKAKGFIRYQIRYMVAAIWAYANERITLEQIYSELKNPNEKLTKKAPASGLILFNTII